MHLHDISCVDAVLEHIRDAKVGPHPIPTVVSRCPLASEGDFARLTNGDHFPAWRQVAHAASTSVSSSINGDNLSPKTSVALPMPPCSTKGANSKVSASLPSPVTTLSFIQVSHWVWTSVNDTPCCSCVASQAA